MKEKSSNSSSSSKKTERKGKGNPRRYGVPQDEIIRALEAKNGLISLAAKALRITHRGLLKRIEGSKELQEVITAINEKNLDLSESVLFSMIKKKSLGAICFHLKCKGKHRGWVERQEVAGVGGQPIRFTVEYVEEKPPGNNN